MAKNLDEILDECINRLNRGESLKACLADYPDHAEQLEPLLQAMLQTQGAYSSLPSADAKREARQRFYAALDRLEERRQAKPPVIARLLAWPLAWATVAVVLLILVVAGYFGLRPMLYPAGPGPTDHVLYPAPPPSTLPVGKGLLQIRVTDPPPPEVDGIYVKLQSLEVHRTGGPWIEIDDVAETDPFNLKEIEDLELFLAEQIVDEGKYTQIRLGIAEKEGVMVDPDENVEGDEKEAKVPSGWIKIVRPFEVVHNGTTVITLDFDGMRSLNETGAGQYMFKPVIKLLVYGPTSAELEIITTSLPNGGIGEEYEATLEATGGEGEYTWTLVENGNGDDELPEGLGLSLDGVISGTPEADLEEDYTDYTFTVQVEDDAEETDTKAFTITIADEGVLIITTTSLPDGMVGEEYEAELEAIGGEGEYTWTLVENGNGDNELPEGLELSSDGVISGTPEADEVSTFEVQVEDESVPDPQSDTQALTISIAKALEIVTTSEDLPEGEVNEAYEAELEATGGVGDYTWTLVDNGNGDDELPDGLALSSDGVISGTPEAGGVFEFEVQVEDEAEETAEKELTITIAAE